MTNLSLSSFLPAILAILVPVLTGLITKFCVNFTKKVDAFAQSRPWVKQAYALVVSVVVSILTAVFHTTDLMVVINALLGWVIAMVLHHGSTPIAPYIPAATQVTTTTADTPPQRLMAP